MIDLLVAGGGPAGLVTALHAARAGLRTAVIEPRTAPIDKACGEGLMPHAVAALRDLDLCPDGVQLRGIRYLQDGDQAMAPFRHGAGLGVRRTELHRVLHEAAIAAGVQVLADRVGELRWHGDSVTAAGIRARYLVAADGLHSGLRRRLGYPAPPSSVPRRWGIRAHYRVRPWSDLVEVYWTPRGEAYVTPVADDCVGVAILGTERSAFAERISGFPELAARLGHADAGRVRAAGPLRQDVRRRVHGRVLLVGDAAGYLDALTGEGLALAFDCAQALVRRVVEDRPARYEHDYLTLSRRYRMITSSLLWAARHPPLRRRIVPAAAHAPWLFRTAVAQLAR
ncbi:MAG: NAD(P)/FAD-dependent oxidoreductase [Jatrophihabitantaceae bacterium]